MTKQRIIRHTLADLFHEFETKRVAVYARVSRKGELKHRSIVAQTENLKHYVEQHPDWVFVDYYVDEGITGTKLNRPEFNRMMRDAKAGKIDIILSKSVSRMGRNSAALFRALQELKELGITVIFDSEQISIDNPQAMFSLQYKGIMAEYDARQLSKYQQWTIRHRYEKGIPNAGRPYGYIMIDHQYHIIPEEAEVIRRIFRMYLDGMGMQAICKTLNEEGITTQRGGRWSQSGLHKLIRNEVYVGDLLLQKSYVADPISKRKIDNHGDLPQYFVKDNHDAIIDRDTFLKVQQEAVRRSEKHGGLNHTYDKKPRLMSHLVYCGHCGSSMYYKDINGDKRSRKTWICRNHSDLGPSYCPTKGVREDILIKATKEVLISEKLIKENTPLTNDLLKMHIRKIIVQDNYELEYHLYNDRIITKSSKCPSRRESWTPEMRQKARERSLALHAKRREEESYG